MSLLTRKLSVFSVFTACAALLAAVLPGTANADQAKQDAVLDEIIVVASKIEIPRRQLGAAVSTIDAEEIELRGYFSIADVLRTQPGIAVSSNGGIGTTTSVRVRGEEAFRTQVFIDGIKASDPSAPQVSPNFDNLLTTSDMQRIEVLRGPQGFIYGADAGGVVSITTRRGDGPLTGRFAAEGGEFGTRRLEGALSGGNDSADFFLSVTDLDTDGFNTRPSDVTLGDDDGYDNTVLHGKFGWQATDNLRLQLVARSSDGETEFDGCGFPTTSDCLDASEETALRLSAELVAGAFSHELSVSRLETDRENLANGTFAFGSEGELQRIEYTGSFVLNDATTFVFGVDHQEEETDASGSDLDRDQTGIYAEYQGSFGDSWFVSAGARYDDNDDFGSFTSIRLSAAYLADIGDAGVLRYRASVGTGFRAPSLFEVAYNAGPFAFPPAAGTTLEEEQTEGYDIGVDWIAETGARIGIGWFDQEVDNAILFDLVGFSGYLQDTGTSSSHGIELDWDVPIDDNWSLIGNATWNDTETPEGEQRIRRPEFFGNIGVLYRGFDERLRVLGNVRSAQDSVDEIFGVGRVDLDNYAVFDLSVSYDVRDYLTAYARVVNAFDEDYQEVVDFDNGGSAAYAGIRLTF